MNLGTPKTVERLQAALHSKAKESPNYRFYALYDKVYRKDVLEYAYRRCRANGGAAGIDGQDFRSIEEYGLEKWIGERTEELRERTYQPDAVRRVYIPKADGKKRPLGIPTVRDRVIQMAAVLVLEPIFEADLQPEQYAYRQGRSALDAVRAVHGFVNTGHTEVVEGDLSGYFDSIPHRELLQSVARRICDRHMLHLIKMWLMAPVEERDEKGHTTRTTHNEDQKKGTPQGAPISPLLANLYMRRFLLGWKTLGQETRLDAHSVNYADDFVICCRRSAVEARRAMEAMMTKLKLTVNPVKTRIGHLPEESFDFLGYTIGSCYSTKTGKSYLGTRPSSKSITQICRAISEETSNRWVLREDKDRVNKLNRLLVGWGNYFCLGPVSKAFRAVDTHALFRLRQWLCRKHKVSGSRNSHFPVEYIYQKLGLKKLEPTTHNLPWASV